MLLSLQSFSPVASVNISSLSYLCCPYPDPNVFQVGLRSITKEGRDQVKRFGVEQYEMRTFSKDCEKLENLVKYFSIIT
jgi:arginase family enzyme